MSTPVTTVKLYDTTLRDGMQGQGMSLSAAEKVRVVQALDRLGVHFIEAGFPSSNPKEEELFELLDSTELETAAVCAFGMTRRRGVAADEDEALRTLVGSFAPVCTLVGKTWGLHLEKVTRVSREENLAMIVDSVNFCRAGDKRVIYDAEHFFDGWRDDSGYALECLRAAVAAGAENVTLCDTNGATLPDEIATVTAAVLEQLGERVAVGIHAHNDAECGVANSLAAVKAGAGLVQGTINGYGERTGNCNLTTIIPNLTLKMGIETIPRDRLDRLTPVAHHVAELVNFTVNPQQPYVGSSSFAHKAGLHTSAIARRKDAYEHIDPEIVGNGTRFLVSEMSGRSTLDA